MMSSPSEEPTDHHADEYYAEFSQQIALEENDTHNWAASHEDGWFYPDQEGDDFQGKEDAGWIDDSDDHIYDPYCRGDDNGNKETIQDEAREIWRDSCRSKGSKKPGLSNLELLEQVAKELWIDAEIFVNGKIFYDLALEAVKYNGAELRKYGLPSCNSLRQVATALGIPVETLQRLAFSGQGATVWHYHEFWVAKKQNLEQTVALLQISEFAIENGLLQLLLCSLHYTKESCRVISSPSSALKQVQSQILGKILSRLEPAIHPSAHGFRASQDKKYSIVTNALPHVGSEFIINLDLKDFFPSITYPRVRGLFKSLGYSKSASNILALLCCVTFKERQSYLPQGAPSSPAITNLICRRLDQKLSKLAEECGCRYTRYADDLTFSRSHEDLDKVTHRLAISSHGLAKKIIREADRVIQFEGFRINWKKVHVSWKHQRQEVTGIIVNRHPSISRKRLKQFRAVLHQIENFGLEGIQWGQTPDTLAAIQGFANYVCMVNPDKGASLQARVRKIKQRFLLFSKS